MLFLFWILLFLYAFLCILYWVAHPGSEKISPWSLIELPPSVEPTPCRTPDDCPPNHLCMKGRCIPKLRRGGRCDPATGQWISYEVQGATVAVCACSDPRLVTQKVFGGNCDVNVGCGVHGRYSLEARRCECDPGYRDTTGRLVCQKRPAAEQVDPCTWDELEIDRDTPHYHFDYLKRLFPKRCVKRPCSADALTGRFLKHARYVPDWGCVCDPRFGLFALKLETDAPYLLAPGYNACASLFREDPPYPLEVELITYFYLNRRPPVSLIVWKSLDTQDLTPFFKAFRSSSLVIRQRLWRYDYAQRYFKDGNRVRARIRRTYQTYAFQIHTQGDTYDNDYRVPSCDRLVQHWENRLYKISDESNLLYRDPVCHLQPGAKADPELLDRVILNPFHVTYANENDLQQYNAFVLKYGTSAGERRWSLDFGDPYRMEVYQNVPTNAPEFPLAMKHRNSLSVIHMTVF